MEPAGVKERRRTRRSAYREKNAERLVQRNGYRDRSGRHAPTLPAAHPQAAQRLLLPGLSRAAADGREDAHRGGPGGLRKKASPPAPSTTFVQAMGMSGISKSQVSPLCAENDDKVKALLNRALHAFQGILRSRKRPHCVTHVSGMNCHPSLRKGIRNFSL